MATLERPVPAGHPPSLYNAEPSGGPTYGGPFASSHFLPVKRPPSEETQGLEPPPKKQSKWTNEENDRIIRLRSEGLKWEEVSRHLPGRSAISCRLHYQNFLERRPYWDDEKKNKLARLYERFRREMWEKVAKELHMPWRAAEEMHWTLGKVELAQRAGVTPFAGASENPASTPAAGVPITTSFGPTSASFRATAATYPGAPQQQPIQPAPLRQSSMSSPSGTYPPLAAHGRHPSLTAQQPSAYLEPNPPQYQSLPATQPHGYPSPRARRSASGASPTRFRRPSSRGSPRRAVSSIARATSASIPPIEARSTPPPPLPPISREHYADGGTQPTQQRLPPVRFLTREPETQEPSVLQPGPPHWYSSSEHGNSIGGDRAAREVWENGQRSYEGSERREHR